MKKLLLLAMVSCCQYSLIAQTANPEKYAAYITGTDLKKHLSVIAGEEMEGRGTGTEGQRKAAAYIEAQFKSLGLAAPAALKGYQQYYPLMLDSLTKATLALNKKEGVFGTDFIIQANTNDNGSFKSNSVVFAGYGIEDDKYNDYKNLNVKGKVVVLFVGEPKVGGKYLVTGTKNYSQWTYPGLTNKLVLAKSKGAIGVIVINGNTPAIPERLIASSKKTELIYPRGESEGKKLNYAVISHAFARNIFGNNTDTLLALAKSTSPFDPQWKKELKVKTNLVFKEDRKTINASNVLGVIEGTDKKDEYVFMTGHYDHLGKHGNVIYYGADDDGSGTCGVIEMATAFSKAVADGVRPRRTLVFMTVSGEEKGLWGSEYYSDHPIYPLEKTTVDLNTDMVGRVDTERKTADTLNYVYVVGHDKISSELPIINEGVNKKYTGLTLDYKFDDPNDEERIYYRSDHYNFARKGVPVLFFYDGMLLGDYHKPTDTVEKINWDLYEKRVRLIFHTAWEMANRDEMLKRDKPLAE